MSACHNLPPARARARARGCGVYPVSFLLDACGRLLTPNKLPFFDSQQAAFLWVRVEYNPRQNAFHSNTNTYTYTYKPTFIQKLDSDCETGRTILIQKSESIETNKEFISP